MHYDHFRFDSHWNDYRCSGQSVSFNDKPENMKEWLSNKLKALASLLGRLCAKAAEVLPGIIGTIITGSSVG